MRASDFLTVADEKGILSNRWVLQGLSLDCLECTQIMRFDRTHGNLNHSLSLSIRVRTKKGKDQKFPEMWWKGLIKILAARFSQPLLYPEVKEAPDSVVQNIAAFA